MHAHMHNLLNPSIFLQMDILIFLWNEIIQLKVLMQSTYLFTLEMSDQEVTYSTLRFLQSPSESQNRLRPDGTQRPDKTEEKGTRLKHLDSPDSCVLAKSLQSCPALCDPMDCSPPGSSVHGISQGRIPEWVAISFSRGSPRPRDRTRTSCLASGFFTVTTGATSSPRRMRPLSLAPRSLPVLRADFLLLI